MISFVGRLEMSTIRDDALQGSKGVVMGSSRAETVYPLDDDNKRNYHWTGRVAVEFNYTKFSSSYHRIFAMGDGERIAEEE